MADALNGFFSTILKLLYSSGDISIPVEYHDRCVKVREMLDNDISGTINTVLDYAINSSSEAKYRVECSEPTLQKLLKSNNLSSYLQVICKFSLYLLIWFITSFFGVLPQKIIYNFL